MSWIIPIFCLLAVLHFVYEGILVPSARLRLRFRLFELRDGLREVSINQGDVDQEIVFIVHESLNTMLSRLHTINIQLLAAVKRAVEKDPELKQRLNDRHRLVESCTNDDLRTIRREMYSIMDQAFNWNTGAWFFYLVPIACFFVLIGTISKAIKWFVDVTEAELNKIIPPSRVVEV